ncbi:MULTISPECIES: ribosome biogenesis GTPase Der [Pseudorhizobium]|uniref:GTPase Der n=1 Tax=Pseudorhizobium pelagicum TaxID=1509405 RepID=A0A922P2S8_9HYPH|nr:MULTISPECIES: ribosome biogenesis GTPase Der [Pseudorhizobium]KEQ08798.1 GTP-binding protein Der [Pseudorhizobium pelagicum]KEQ09786.1 GTP-binding protein Der [Pseudorhizobium pelagicum]MBA4785687.1 ribosome biogenesis GTPase Der [Hyphomicrobiales bacterium]MDY6963043.1 ribosome biogenesis GTPase Der [Pseudomonadota bacterium]|tara:strand:+ start:1793 stop:3217 length:1425 start_codon:yes stop_codon:yes gene_type:complete
MSFTVAIVGRPNVGKSTLFNRLVGKKLALVDDTPGVTRDRRPGDAKLIDLRFTIIDTAGLEEVGPDTLEGRMRAQTEIAIGEADLTLFVVDAKSGLTPLDKTFGELLRRSGKPVVLVANKSEAKGSDGGFYDAYTLGLGEPVPISAEHGQGMIDLRDAIVEAIGGEDVAFPPEVDEPETNVDLRGELEFEDEDYEPEYDDSKPLRVAIIGRPNAGKSTLINRFLGEDRLLTGPEAGITRDSISVEWDWRGRTIKMFDTAGMRKKARVQEKLEKLSVADALRSIRFAETVVIVFDSTIPFEKQDLQLVDLVIREGRAAVLAFNKWDLVEYPQEVLAELREKTERLLPQARGIRAVPMSGQTGYGLDKLMQSIIETDMVWNKRISTAKLNRWLDGVQIQHPPPAVSGRRLKLKYMTQVKARPPAFMISCTRPDSVPESYIRYLTNGLRADFDMPGVPIRIHLRAAENPFESKRKRR